MPRYARPDLEFASPDELHADVELLRTTSYDKAGEWDLPTIVDHVSSAILSPFDPSARAVPRPLRWAARLFVRRMGKRKKYPSFKMRAPKTLTPRKGLSMDQVIPRFEEALQTLRSLPQPRVQTAIAGPLDSNAYRRLQLLHAAHHLAFLKPRR